MGGGRIKHETLRGPNLIKEICIATGLALVAGSFWKKAHNDMKKQRRHFYDMLDRGDITLVVDE